MHKRLRIGIVGAGFGRYGLLPAFQRDSRCEVVDIVTSSGWEHLVSRKDIDAVAIAIPPVFQAPIALMALYSGKAVFAEKPLAAAIGDAEKLVKAAEESNLANVVDFMFPELLTFAKAKQLLDEGCIGTPLHIKADWIFWSHDHRNNVTTWRTDAESGGGALAHFGSHMLYYLQWFLGPIVSVAGRVHKPSDYQHSGDTLATLMLGFDNGASGTLTVSSGTPTMPRHSIQILGTDGSLMLSNTSGSPVSFTLQHKDGVMSEPEQSGVDCRVPAVSRIVHRFIDWILTGEKAKPSFRDGLEVQRVIEAAMKCQ